MENSIEYKVWNINFIVDEIRQAPQTYETILKNEIKNRTLLIILGRKLNTLIKDGHICKTTIPATRYSRVIYYALPKEYFILFESSRLGCNVFYFNEYKTRKKFYIEVNGYYQLERGTWQPKYKKIFFEGNILKMI